MMLDGSGGGGGGGVAVEASNDNDNGHLKCTSTSQSYPACIIVNAAVPYSCPATSTLVADYSDNLVSTIDAATGTGNTVATTTTTMANIDQTLPMNKTEITVNNINDGNNGKRANVTIADDCKSDMELKMSLSATTPTPPLPPPPPSLPMLHSNQDQVQTTPKSAIKVRFLE